MNLDAESAALWERWLNIVEGMLGHSIEGDKSREYAAWKRGTTAYEYVSSERHLRPYR